MGFDRRVRDRRDHAVTGNLYVLLTLAKGIVSFLPAVGPATVHRSRTIARRTSNYRTALIGMVTASFRRPRAIRRRSDATGPRAAHATEAVSP